MKTRDRFRNKDGTLTRYSFFCGYVETYGRATISREPNGFHVKGFDAQGTHFWEIFEHVKAARSFARKAAR